MSFEFRPDQRALEEGNIDAAETLKLQLEQAQRERRKKTEEDSVKYVPKWFRYYIVHPLLSTYFA